MILREKKIWKVVNGEEKKPAPDDDKYNTRLFSDSDDNSSDTQDFDLVTYQRDIEVFKAKVDNVRNRTPILEIRAEAEFRAVRTDHSAAPLYSFVARSLFYSVVASLYYLWLF